MKYLAILSIFLFTSCDTIRSFNDWADDVMPNQSDFRGGSKTVYQNTNPQHATPPTYSQPANPGYVRPDQPNAIAPGGVLNSPSYQPQYQQPAAQYQPPVNNLPPMPNEQQKTEQYQRDYWDSNIPQPPIGY